MKNMMMIMMMIKEKMEMKMINLNRRAWTEFKLSLYLN